MNIFPFSQPNLTVKTWRVFLWMVQKQTLEKRYLYFTYNPSFNGIDFVETWACPVSHRGSMSLQIHPFGC